MLIYLELPHPWSRDRQGQETTIPPNSHMVLGLSRIKIKWGIYANLPRNAIIRLPHPIYIYIHKTRYDMMTEVTEEGGSQNILLKVNV